MARDLEDDLSKKPREMSNIINAYNDSAHHVIQNNILKEDTKFETNK